MAIPPVLPESAAYVCPACGEEIVIPVDPSQGREQEFVEDCPVCCRPNVVRLFIGDDGNAVAAAQPEA